MKNKKVKIPNPGSAAAIKKGCTCPIMDNHNGKGFPYGDVKQAFWISGDCKLHTLPKEAK